MSWSARLAAVTAALVALAVAGSAFAGEVTVDFTAKVRPISGGDRMQYHGRVSSEVEACQVGRKVRISLSGDLIGKTETRDNGKFSLKADAVEDDSSVKFKFKPNRPLCPSETLFVEVP
jgi:hypothetical protein